MNVRVFRRSMAPLIVIVLAIVATLIARKGSDEDALPRPSDSVVPSENTPPSSSELDVDRLLSDGINAASQECYEVERLVPELGVQPPDPLTVGRVWFERSDYARKIGSTLDPTTAMIVEACTSAASRRFSEVRNATYARCGPTLTETASRFGLPPNASPDLVAGTVAREFEVVWRDFVYGVCISLLDLTDATSNE